MILPQAIHRKGFPVLESTRNASSDTTANHADLAVLLQKNLLELERLLVQFLDQMVTPAAFHQFESDLQGELRLIGRTVLEHVLAQLEPADAANVAPRVSFQGESYRRRPRQPKTIYSSFGPIEYSRFRYEACERGNTSIFPLDLHLGLQAHLATPVLAEQIGRLAVDHEQSQVLSMLRRDHGVCWAVKTLRKVTAALSEGLAAFREDAQVSKALDWLKQAFASKGRYRPVLTIGRDGIMVPIRKQKYKEASAATLAIYNRSRKRIGTIYLGFMPEAGQLTMTEQLTSLVTRVLEEWHKLQQPCPRLAYLTDGGHHPREYYLKVLKRMPDLWSKNPKQKLAWQWILDYWHVCGYINKLATALFGDNGKAWKWFAKMRHWLRDRSGGLAHVLQSATQYMNLAGKLSKARDEQFWDAYQFLRKNARWMQYADYHRHGMPIGSGITEAACKTVFTQRLKRSGMTWQIAGGQRIVDLRVLKLSGVWNSAHASFLNAMPLPTQGSCATSIAKMARKAA